jgi:hypothetical protein
VRRAHDVLDIFECSLIAREEGEPVAVAPLAPFINSSFTIRVAGGPNTAGEGKLKRMAANPSAMPIMVGKFPGMP